MSPSTQQSQPSASVPSVPYRSRLLAVVAVGVGLASTLVGCRSLAPSPPPPTIADELPWELPAATLGTQRLIRLRYSGPEGDGTVHLTLRLESPSRYQLTAADRFGGRLWAVEAQGDDGIWIDFRQRTFCRRPQDVQLFDWGPAGGLDALPRMLLGRLPVVPVAPPDEEVAATLPALNLLDSRGRHWTGRVGDDGAVDRWELWEVGEAAWWWRREGSGAALSQYRGERELRWQEVAAERLPGPLQALTVPRGFAEECW